MPPPPLPRHFNSNDMANLIETHDAPLTNGSTSSSLTTNAHSMSSATSGTSTSSSAMSVDGAVTPRQPYTPRNPVTGMGIDAPMRRSRKAMLNDGNRGAFLLCSGRCNVYMVYYDDMMWMGWNVGLGGFVVVVVNVVVAFVASTLVVAPLCIWSFVFVPFLVLHIRFAAIFIFLVGCCCGIVWILVWCKKTSFPTVVLTQTKLASKCFV